ncbi:hypothetical protein NM208_g3183 [Fusarium decemcellulare]|uniref:Uncharacterized protein n=1 Tax=Fusarium decemcellulare TaxID=57161 RepID=A0ACC1SQJ7_9HYPO|nr:hypothetical protein NM208_g3183 [Fusarium decemcellulare]
MKKSLLEIDSHGDALLILRRPNAQPIPSSENQETPDGVESPKLGANASTQTRKTKSTKSPTTLEDLKSIRPYHENGEPNEIHFQVSSRHLSIVSPVFRAMIEGKYKESQPNHQGLMEIGASEWNAQALLILLDIIHGHHRDVPKTLDLEAIVQIGFLVDYYDCLEVVEIFFDRWCVFFAKWIEYSVDSLFRYYTPKVQRFGQDETLLLFIAWVFRSGAAFSNLTSSAAFNGERLIETDLPIPNKILAKIEERRVELIDQLFSRLYNLQEDLVVGRVGCCLECSCRLLGYLMKEMRNRELPATKPDKPFSGYSVPSVLKIINSITTPVWKTRKAIDACKLEKHLYLNPSELEAQVAGLRLEDFQ